MTHMTMENKAMTKKGHQIFGQEKCTPEKILATPMAFCIASSVHILAYDGLLIC